MWDGIQNRSKQGPQPRGGFSDGGGVLALPDIELTADAVQSILAAGLAWLALVTAGLNISLDMHLLGKGLDRTQNTASLNLTTPPAAMFP